MGRDTTWFVTPGSVYMAPPTVSLDDYRRALIAQPDPCHPTGPALAQAIIMPRLWSLVIRARSYDALPSLPLPSALCLLDFHNYGYVS